MDIKPLAWYPWYYATYDWFIIGRSWKILSWRLSDRYYKVALPVDGKQKDFLVHRMIAIAFIPNPDNKKYVNHIDGNKLNNAVPNLEWCTHTENVRHAYATGLNTVDHLLKKVWQYKTDKHTLIKQFNSITEAAQSISLHPSSISMVVNGKRHSAWWYYWKYL